MQLLEKRQVDIEKQAQQKLEIDQGMFLARKIEALREAHGREEKNLADFRKNAIKEVVAEIESLTKERDQIKSLIEEANTILIEKRKPLDKEWENLRQQKETIEAKLQELNHEIELQHISLIVIQKKEYEANAKLEKSKDIELQATKKLQRATQIENQAQEILGKAHNQQEKFSTEEQVIRRELTHRENKVALRERDVLLKEQTLKKQEKEISKKKLRYGIH